MPANHDYICPVCFERENDMLSKPLCPQCNLPMEITFENWTTIQTDARHDERLDANGAVRAFSALDDPIASAQLGINPKLKQYCKTSPEEQVELQQRIVKDGDSPKLRRELLNKYNDRTGKKFEVSTD